MGARVVQKNLDSSGLSGADFRQLLLSWGAGFRQLLLSWGAGFRQLLFSFFRGEPASASSFFVFSWGSWLPPTPAQTLSRPGPSLPLWVTQDFRVFVFIFSCGAGFRQLLRELKKQSFVEHLPRPFPPLSHGVPEPGTYDKLNKSPKTNDQNERKFQDLRTQLSSEQRAGSRRSSKKNFYAIKRTPDPSLSQGWTSDRINLMNHHQSSSS